MPKKRIHKDRSTDTRPKTRNRVECNCTLHCNGSKWVDPRTFERHQQEIERFRTITSVPQSTSQFRSSMSSSVDVGSSTSKAQREEGSKKKKKKKVRIRPILVILIVMSPIKLITRNRSIYQQNENVILSFVKRNLSRDRKSTRLNSSHDQISYAVFCLKKKKEH